MTRSSRAGLAILAALAAMMAVLTPAASAAPGPAHHRAKPGPAALRVLRADPPAVPHPKSAQPGTALARQGGVPGGDEIITATSDTGGYHLFAAAAGDRWRWHPLATLQPGRDSEGPWIGEYCVTGNGRQVVAVVAPWSAQNSAAGIAAGGLAYAIDAHTGKVRPLAAGLLLAYFNPGCGSGSSVALSRYARSDQSVTQVLMVNAASGAVTQAPVIANQVTSAVPAGGTLYAAEGHRLVRISGSGAVMVVGRYGGPVFDLTPNASGGVDYMAAAKPAADGPGGVYRAAAGVVRRLASGNLRTLRLLPGLGGRTTVLGGSGGRATVPGGTVRALPPGVSADRFADASDQGSMIVKPGGRPGVVTLTATSGAASGGGALPAPAPPFAALPRTRPVVAGAKGRAPMAVTPGPPNGGGDVGATCAIPRNDPDYQVPQPSDQEIDWALNLAGQYGLPGRRDGYANLHTGAYDPSADFPLPAPFDGTTGIPRQVMEGVFAQESNWKQASPHVPAGLWGNPLISDYYGINSPRNTSGNIDYGLADCGYGLGQLTSMMYLPAPGDAPTSLQQRVAVDYTENAAASAQVLAQKWAQLARAGITIGDDNPMEIEDWYFTLWAYNTGVNPQASTGGGGCTPGPSCTDSAGNWGLGWTNNPANPTYDPLRHPFLHAFDAFGDPVETYADAATPQDWPYQEKVFGWIESGQMESNGSLKYSPTYDYATGSGFLLDLPGIYAFCDSSSNCSPLAFTQPCGYSGAGPLQWHCWWHQSVPSWCPVACNDGDWNATVSDPEPTWTAPNPFPSVCRPPSDWQGAYIVDDSQDEVNLAGCTGMAPANAPMRWLPSTDASGQPYGDIDLHQLGTGYGGRSMFTHLEDPSNAIWGGTMAWQPRNLDYDVYDVEVFIPTLGAAGTLDYHVVNNGKTISTVAIDQDNYGNEWVPLGLYYLAPGAEVTASNVVSGGDGSTDVSFDAIAFRPVSSYVSLGDSYSSGEGSGAGHYDGDNGPMPHDDLYHGPFDDGHSTDQSGVNTCHRSPDSYARVWAANQNASTGAGIPMVQLACSGAVIANMTTAGQDGEPPQIQATPRHAIDVFLTIGGNDAGFGPVLAHCLTPGNSCEAYWTQPNGTVQADGSTFNGNLDATVDSLTAPLSNAYRLLRAQAPQALVNVLTYPSIFPPTTSGSTCVITTGLGLAAQDAEWLISESSHLDSVIARAVNPLIVPGSAVTFALNDERYAFAGHELCSAAPDGAYLNGLTLSAGSFHPNPAGYAQEAADLAASPLGNWQHYSSLHDPPPGTPDLASAKVMLGLLGTGTYNATGYNRGDFQPPPPPGSTTQPAWTSWPDYAGCTSGQLTLLLDNEATPFAYPLAAGTCPDTSYSNLPGTPYWHTPYDNPPVTVTPSNANAAARPNADHVVPLKDAYGNGAAAWSSGLKIDFANAWYGINLITASAQTNLCPPIYTYPNGKCDSSIEEWQPPNTAYLCTYARLWVAIKYQWNLRADNTKAYDNPGRPGNGYTEDGFLNAVLYGKIPVANGGCPQT